MEIKNASASQSLHQLEALPAGLEKPKVSEDKSVLLASEIITKEKLVEKVDSMNDFLEPTNTSVKFKFHDELGKYYIQVIDSFTDEVIKEIPNKKFLDMYASMAEFAGLFVDEKL